MMRLRGAAAIAVAAAPVARTLHLIGSIIGALLDHVMAGATALHPTGIVCLGQRAFDPLRSAPADPGMSGCGTIRLFAVVQQVVRY